MINCIVRRCTLLVCLISLSVAAAGPTPKGPLSDALKVPRPQGGENFGLYLLNKKVGYAFNDLSLVLGRLTSYWRFV